MALLCVMVLTGLCQLPQWSGTNVRGLSAQELREAVMSPAVPAARRRVLLLEAHRRAVESVGLLVDLSAEDSAEGDDSRRYIDDLRKLLGR